MDNLNIATINARGLKKRISPYEWTNDNSVDITLISGIILC